LILHDRRGTGASSRNVAPPNLETRAADLLAVLDVVGSEAPVLVAAASTGAMHALFAATHPSRTSGLFRTYPRPRLAWDPDYPWGQRPEDFERAMLEGRNWATTENVRELALSRAAQRAGVPHEQRHSLTVDEELVQLYARINRNTASPDVAEALTRISWQTDVRQVITTPTTATLHKARYSAGQRVLDATGNLKAVQKLLGHESIQTTGDIYVDWDINRLAETLLELSDD